MEVNILGNNIKTLRENRSLTQMEFAKILNISNTTLSQYEAGNRIPNDEIKLKIADYFNVTVDFLLGRKDNSYVNEKEERYTFENKIHNDIEGLSSESKKELEKYIQLLKLKDSMERTKDKTSSTLAKGTSQNK